MIWEEIELVGLIFKVDQKNISYFIHFYSKYYKFSLVFLSCLKLSCLSNYKCRCLKKNYFVLYVHVYTHILIMERFYKVCSSLSNFFNIFFYFFIIVKSNMCVPGNYFNLILKFFLAIWSSSKCLSEYLFFSLWCMKYR